jgi:hypothetical protein
MMWIVPALDEAKNRVMDRLSRMECLDPEVRIPE